MGWDAIVTGELKFPKGGLAKWKAAPASLPDRAWPEMIAMAVDDSTYDEPPTVEEMLEEIADEDRWFGNLEIADPSVRIGYNIDNNYYAEAGDRLVRVVCAAAKAGAKGRVLFCDANDAGGGHGTFTGALFVLEGGKLRCDTQSNAVLSASDRKLVEAALESYTRASAKAKRKKS